MPLFVVIGLKDSADGIDAAVSASITKENRYKIEAGKWVVVSDISTAKELSIALNVRETYTHLVFPMRGYSGRAQPDLWEWIAAKSEKVNG